MEEKIEPVTQVNPEETPEVLRAKIAQLEQDKTSLVGETQELRRSRQEKEDSIQLLQDQLKAAVLKNNENPEEQKIASVVQKLLGDKEQQEAERNRKAAFDQFINEHKEYHPDNDPSGLKRAALEKELASFNLTGIVEVGDFKSRVEKADRLLRGSTTRETVEGTSLSSGPTSTTVIEPKPSTAISAREKEVIERNGWTEEQYLNLKAKMPGFIESLFE